MLYICVYTCIYTMCICIYTCICVYICYVLYILGIYVTHRMANLNELFSQPNIVLLLNHFSCVLSVRSHRRQPTRLLCLWDCPGKNTGVGCHFRLQCMLSHFSCVWLCATLWTAAHQAPPSIGFSRQEYWSCHFLLQPNIIIVYNIYNQYNYNSIYICSM